MKVEHSLHYEREKGAPMHKHTWALVPSTRGSISRATPGWCPLVVIATSSHVEGNLGGIAEAVGCAAVCGRMGVALTQDAAATKIQSAMRGFLWRMRIRREANNELMFIGMKPRVGTRAGCPSALEWSATASAVLGCTCKKLQWSTRDASGN
jgi:hypothetical protein